MQCTSCKINIDPKWKYAIEKNICPFCGENIMDEYLKNLLVSLREAMDKLSEYETELEDFMLSNFQFVKTTSPNLINFVPEEMLNTKPKVFKNKRVTEEVQVEEPAIKEDKLDFYKRAGIKNPNTASDKVAHIKRLAEENKNSTEEDSSMADINIANLLAQDLSEYAEENPEDFEKNNLDDLDGDLDKIPSSVLKFANKFKNPDSAKNDLETLKRLKEDAEKRSSKFIPKRD